MQKKINEIDAQNNSLNDQIITASRVSFFVVILIINE